MALKKGGLGRGLDSLMNENALDDNLTATLRLSEIEPNKDQPRILFDEESLEELAESIRVHGLLQPIVVRPMVGGTYQIVAGERRWRACRKAGVTAVPVVIKSLDDKQTMELALIENLQRMDLNPVEEAKGYAKLIMEFDLTQESVAQRVGKSRSAVTNALRLLNLPDDMLNALSQGRISAGHARALLAFEDTALQQEAFIAAAEGASVRQIEQMAKAAAKPKKQKLSAHQNGFFREVELAIKNETHRKAVIKEGKDGRGTITIEFYNNAELTEFANKLVGKQQW